MVWCWLEKEKPQVPTDKENMCSDGNGLGPLDSNVGFGKQSQRSPINSFGRRRAIWGQGGWDPECTQHNRDSQADSWPVGATAALPPTTHGCSATLQPSGASALGTRALQGEPPTTRPGTLTQEWTLRGGPPAPGVAGWLRTCAPGLSKVVSLHPDLWLPGRHSAWFPNKHATACSHVARKTSPSPGRRCSCTTPLPPMPPASPHRERRVFRAGEATCSNPVPL